VKNYKVSIWTDDSRRILLIVDFNRVKIFTFNIFFSNFSYTLNLLIKLNLLVKKEASPSVEKAY
jgi:hypothetical protein